VSAALWVFTAALAVVGSVGILLAHFVSWAAPMLVFGPILLALAVVISMVGAGIRNPIAIIVVFVGLEVLFIGFNAYNWFGLRGVL
jgi:hypothetical protein